MKAPTLGVTKMRKSIGLLAVVALILAAAAPEGWAKKSQSEIPFSIAKMIIEFNSTANEGVGDGGCPGLTRRRTLAVA
jgi:hypothetical protein